MAQTEAESVQDVRHVNTRPATSGQNYMPRHDEVTVRFKRWHQCYGTAYQRGQEAGFGAREAMVIVASGVADIVHDMRAISSAAMVRK